MNKEIISKARAVAPKILYALKSVDVFTNEESSVVALVCGTVLNVLSAIEKLADGGPVSDDDRMAAVDAAVAAAFAAKFKEDL